MAFELPPLPYPHSALAERGMCQETMELHHDKHHQAYVTALNGFVEKNPELAGKSLDEIIQMSNGKADMAPVFNNAGQHWNHILFWQNMSPQGGGMPGALETKITGDFGSVQAFKDAFKAAAVGQFAVIELTSSPGSARLVRAARRLGCGPATEYFYAEHVEADAVHEQVLRREVLAPMLADEPHLAGDIVFGIQASQLLGGRFADEVLDAWAAGRSSLR